MRTIFFLVWKEYLHVLRDRATLFQVVAIPMIQLVVLSFAATFEVRESAVYLVDLDRTPASRQLASHFEASGFFRIADAGPSMDAASAALVKRDATLILHIPADFEKDVVTRGVAPVQLVLDAEQGTAAGLVRGYATRILEDFGASIAAETGPVVEEGGARTRAQPIRIDVRSRGWFNPELNYTDYMVPGILVALVTLIGTLLTAQNIARERELGTLEQLNVTPVTRAQFIAGKLIPFWILGMVEFGGGLALGRLVFDIPMRGSLWLILIVAAIYLVAALALGLLISTVADTQQQAMFVTFFLMMIYLLLSGLYTPVHSMPQWIQWLAELNPVKHFVYVMRSVMVRGSGAADLAPEIAILTAFAGGLLLLAVQRYSKRTA